MSAISVQHVSRLWGATRAVDDVSFEAPAGKMLVLLGPSGCGKSTTLRLIAGLEQASGGTMSVTGEQGQPPVKPGCTIGDTGTGMLMAISILGALYEKRETGKGRRLQLAMQDSVMHYIRTSFAAMAGHSPTSCSAPIEAPSRSSRERTSEGVVSSSRNRFMDSCTRFPGS